MKKYMLILLGGGLLYASPPSLEWSQKIGYGKLKSAIRYCENLTEAGKSDWRLPKIKELFTLVNYARTKPLKESSWSSSPFYYGRYTQDYRKEYYFYISENGLIQDESPIYEHAIRCVRSR